jgi:methionyl-tRNA synthetase
LAECTFQPNITQKSAKSAMNSARRTTDEFFADMKRFEEVKKKRLEEQKKVLEEKELEECKRSISRSRHDLSLTRLGMHSARGPQIPIHERLFS